MLKGGVDPRGALNTTTVALRTLVQLSVMHSNGLSQPRFQISDSDSKKLKRAVESGVFPSQESRV